jgi:hypothetical protein
LALSKSGSSITQLTAAGTSTTIDVSGAYDQVLGVRLYNGTSGTPTTVATAKVQWKRSGGIYWYDIGTVGGDLVASSVTTYTFDIPNAVASLQVLYTVPSGGSVAGFTCDAEVGTMPTL